MYGMHKISVYVIFTQMTAKKGMTIHGEWVVAAIYKEYTQLEVVQMMGALDLDSLTKSQKRGEYL